MKVYTLILKLFGFEDAALERLEILHFEKLMMQIIRNLQDF